MKRRIAFILVLVILVSFFNFSISADKSSGTKSLLGKEIRTFEAAASEPNFKYNTPEEMLSSMEAVCENEKYRMYFHSQSLAVGILDKKSEKIHFTNPHNAESSAEYLGENAERISSQVVLDYVDADNVSKQLFSSTDAVALGQFAGKIYENGIEVEFSIGEEHETPMFPTVMSVADYKKFLSGLKTLDKKRIENYFILIDISKITDEGEKKQLIDKYPLLKKEPLYIIGVELTSREQLIIAEIFRENGYTKEKYSADSKKYGFELETEKYPNFKLKVRYVLTENGLTVTVPVDSIRFDSQNFKLREIEILPYFLSEKCDPYGQGYIFIPDGSGAIIDINNIDKNYSSVISATVYGEDCSNIQEETLTQTQSYYLPVYGIVKNNNSGIFSVISGGNAMSRIITRPGELSSVYNSFVYTSNIKLTKDAKVSSMNSAKSLYLFSKNISKNDFSIDYYFLSGENVDYCDMANIYRNCLMKEGMSEVRSASKPKIVLNTIGSALYEDSFLGFTYKNAAEFTGYLKNLDIIDYLKDKGFDDISLIMSGWQKNGLDSSLNKKIKFSSVLGGKKDFKKLIQGCKERSIEVYVTQNVVFAENNSVFDSFVKRTDTAKTLERKFSGIGMLDYNTRHIEINALTVSPSKYVKFLDLFFNDCDRFGVDGINLGSMGNSLNSDFSDGANASNRNDSQNAVKSLLKKQKQSKVAFEGANSYVLAYADQILNIPLSGSGIYEEKASVPFLQLVLSGCVSYSSDPLNMVSDTKTALLKCIESGTSPAFLLAADNIELLKLTEHNHLYACSFENLKERVEEYCDYVFSAFSATEGTPLIEHKCVSDKITLSYFKNGTVICVNRSSQEYQINGITVPPMEYKVI